MFPHVGTHTCGLQEARTVVALCEEAPIPPTSLRKAPLDTLVAHAHSLGTRRGCGKHPLHGPPLATAS